MHLDAHLVPVRGAERRDRGIVHHLHLARQRDARRIVDAIRRELVDEHVAFDEQRGDAKRQIELRRGQPIGLVRPAGVIDRDLRGVHHDAPRSHRASNGRRLRMSRMRVERGVVAADAGIEFERDAHGLEALAEPGAQLREIEAVLRARKRRAEAAIRRLEHVDDAGKTLARQQRGIKPALRRAAGMHALDHGAILRRHQAGRLRAGDAERVHGRVRRRAPSARAAPAAAENTPTVAPECQPWPICSWPMHRPTRGPIS